MCAGQRKKANAKNGPIGTTSWPSEKIAETAQKYLRAGSLVYIQGENRTAQWEHEGQTHYRARIYCRQLCILSPKDKDAPQQTSIPMSNPSSTPISLTSRPSDRTAAMPILTQLTQPLRELLAPADTTEIVMNRYGRALRERAGRWEDLPPAHFDKAAIDPLIAAINSYSHGNL